MAIGVVACLASQFAFLCRPLLVSRWQCVIAIRLCNGRHPRAMHSRTAFRTWRQCLLLKL
eukprot:3399351-Amphidinium_carterae.1